MPPLADCYVLVNARSKSLVDEFLAHFLPCHRPSADEYEMPQYSDNPEQVFHAADEALSYLEEHPNEAHALYLANEASGEPCRGMVFPTLDGQMIFGLSYDCSNEVVLDRFLERMKSFLKSSIGYICFEEPPPRTAEEFVKVTKLLTIK
jgi:hypothetical protein